jgi:hypothetical protein
MVKINSTKHRFSVFTDHDFLYKPARKSIEATDHAKVSMIRIKRRKRPVIPS